MRRKQSSPVIRRHSPTCGIRAASSGIRSSCRGAGLTRTIEFFKKNPKATLEVHIDSVRVLGRHTALEEGTLRLRLAGEKEPGESRYSVLHVHEEDGWRMAEAAQTLGIQRPNLYRKARQLGIPLARNSE